jgi:hypothetical protein
MAQVSQRTATDLAEDLLSSVASNCEPGEVFPVHELAGWAEDNDYVKLDTIASTHKPNEVFTYDQLSDWARSEGFALEIEAS